MLIDSENSIYDLNYVNKITKESLNKRKNEDQLQKIKQLEQEQGK